MSYSSGHASCQIQKLGAVRSIGLGDHQLLPVWKVKTSPDARLNTGQVDFTISNADTVYQTQKLDGSATKFPLGIVVTYPELTLLWFRLFRLKSSIF